eukprot:1145376-Pelagomonas_calceolata.AAC.2
MSQRAPGSPWERVPALCLGVGWGLRRGWPGIVARHSALHPQQAWLLLLLLFELRGPRHCECLGVQPYGAL